MSNRPISDVDQPDPWLIPSPHNNGLFYITFSLGNRIEIWASGVMEDFHSQHTRKAKVYAPRNNIDPWSCDIWAPELHYINGTWYIYSCACMPDAGNAGHRTIALRCSGQDPLVEADWHFLGPLRGLPDDQWSIDATVFTPNGRSWYVCYSGWPLGDHSDTQQDLFLARLLDGNPVVADPTSLTCIARAELDWERPDHGRRGVNEGPTWLHIPATGWRGIVFSGHGSWTSEYKLGLLRFVGRTDQDLCNAALWRKRPQPLLVSDPAMGPPFGPGHASFVLSPHADGGVYCVYHGTEKENEGWANRKARVLMLAPESFEDGAAPLCCAYRAWNRSSGPRLGGSASTPAA
jgi:GH43 family beta-xylosidase